MNRWQIQNKPRDQPTGDTTRKITENWEIPRRISCFKRWNFDDFLFGQKV